MITLPIHLPIVSMRPAIFSACCLLVSFCALLSGCSGISSSESGSTSTLPLLPTVNRLSWGINSSSFAQANALGLDRYLEQQLHPQAAKLPAEIQSRIDAMSSRQTPLAPLILELEQIRKNNEAIKQDDAKKAAQMAFGGELNRRGREAQMQSLLRALYSSNQLQERMTWFWFNHFNIYKDKHDLRAMLADYEQQAIAPRALGKFRALLDATAHHPAMLSYLDNEVNALKHVNENFARELLELHTLGVDGGYSQTDVQEMARILTGVGVNRNADQSIPKMKPDLQTQYVRNGLFEFNPARHDYGDKHLLGHLIKGRGLAELDEALDLLARHPATAHYVSRKLVMYFAFEQPPPALVERMAQTFLHSDGDISATLGTLFHSPEFAATLGHKFKDPMHYVLSSVRLAYDDKPVLNAEPMLDWLIRMGELLYNRQTPDGYPLLESAWASPGQMSTRFEVAKAIGSGNAALFKPAGTQVQQRAAFPQLSNAMYFQGLRQTLSPATLKALDQATSPQEWNVFLLSSPEMMRH